MKIWACRDCVALFGAKKRRYDECPACGYDGLGAPDKEWIIDYADLKRIQEASL